ncbi:MAG: PhoPQ-activated pathogenicity-related family protein [Verrucomicrobiae bacterium]|nr:PhoPQ-activated pathogenicity-related family protein [Verrucomicrobiae bacterium]
MNKTSHSPGRIVPLPSVSKLAASVAVLTAAMFVPALGAAPKTLTALDRYVAAPDTNYTYRCVHTESTPQGKVHVLEMTSQSWLTSNEVDRTLWQHTLFIAVPNRVTNRTAFLMIGGGNNKRPPGRPEGNLARIAVETESVVADLRHVPNQPLIFHNDGKERVEDDLIAYTWRHFLRTGDERWPARLPMTKSAVRAMDTITAFCASPEGGGIKVDRFVVGGGSKRGWTTWTTAAVDPRVVGIVPIVIDVVNVKPSMEHHYAAYGFWSSAVGNYTAMRIMDWVDTPEFAKLMQIEDPWSYRDRYTMPKLIVNGTGDQFFLPDSWQFYWDGMPNPKLLRYVPNADHSLRNTDAWQTLQAFYMSLLQNKRLPRFTWKFLPDGGIKVKATDKPREVRLWHATNPEARDFRLEMIGPVWTNSVLTLEKGECIARVPEPAKGWTAFMVELTFDGPAGLPFKLTTGVRVVPDKVNYRFVPNPAGRTAR